MHASYLIDAYTEQCRKGVCIPKFLIAANTDFAIRRKYLFSNFYEVIILVWPARTNKIKVFTIIIWAGAKFWALLIQTPYVTDV